MGVMVPCRLQAQILPFLGKPYARLNHCSDFDVTLLSGGCEAWPLPLPAQSGPGASALLLWSLIVNPQPPAVDLSITSLLPGAPAQMTPIEDF